MVQTVTQKISENVSILIGTGTNSRLGGGSHAMAKRPPPP